MSEKQEKIKGIICYYKKLRGYDKLSHWDKYHFTRNLRPTKALLEIFNDDVEKILKCIDWVADKMNKNNLNWTLETVIKFEPDYTLQHQKREIF